MPLRHFCRLIVFVACVTGCGKSTTVDLTARKGTSEHFQMSYYGLDSIQVDSLLNYLESNRSRVMADLKVEQMPPVEIIMHTDSSFEARWGSVIKRSGLSFQVQGLANGVSELHVYGPWAVEHVGALKAVLLHEFAHGVTLQFALAEGDSTQLKRPGVAESKSASQDRWLAEAIALYEAKQSKDLNWVSEIRNGDYPTLAELNDPANNLIYSVGYRIIEYVRLKYGADAVTGLILSHGDVKATLGVTPTQFEDDWYDWVVDRYLILSPKLFGSSRYSRRAH